jgi:NAD(P)H-flavin reductase
LAAPSEAAPGRAQAVLTARRDAGGGVSLITLTPPPELARAYRAPGQYIKVHAESGGYFVLASEIGAPSWQLLVKNSGGAADALTRAPEGTTFEVTGPLGTGFPLERARDKPLVVAVAGSALAAARPILRERIAQRACASTSLYIGARSARDVPLVGEVAGWGRAGARLVLCLSRPDTDDPALLAEAVRRSGWVQHVLAEELAAGRITHGLVFAAGPAGMLEEIRTLPSRRPERGAEHGQGEADALEVVTNV